MIAEVPKPSSVFSSAPIVVKGGALSGAGMFSVPSVLPAKNASCGQGTKPDVRLNSALNDFDGGGGIGSPSWVGSQPESAIAADTAAIEARILRLDSVMEFHPLFKCRTARWFARCEINPPKPTLAA